MTRIRSWLRYAAILTKTSRIGQCSKKALNHAGGSDANENSGLASVSDCGLRQKAGSRKGINSHASPSRGRPLSTLSASRLERRDIAQRRPRGLGNFANQAGFLPTGLTPSVDGMPRVSRKWVTEAFPKSGRLSNASSDCSRTSPTILMPAANSAFLIRVGNRTSRIDVLSGSSGVGSELARHFLALSFRQIDTILPKLRQALCLFRLACCRADFIGRTAEEEGLVRMARRSTVYRAPRQPS